MEMRREIFYFSISFILVNTACWKGPGLFKQEGKEDAVLLRTTLVSEGVSNAVVSANATSNQALSLEVVDGFEGMNVVFPPGSLDIDSTVTVQQGSSLSTLASSLVSNSTLAASNSVVILSSNNADASSPFTLELPVSTSSLRLGDFKNQKLLTTKNYAVVYRVKRHDMNGQLREGVLGGSAVTLSGNKVFVQTKYFGQYQLIQLMDELKASQERESSQSEILTKKAESTLKPPSFTNFVLSFSSNSTKANINYGLSDSTSLDCYLALDSDKSWPWDDWASIGSVKTYEFDRSKISSNGSYAKLFCITSSGKELNSDWSGVLKNSASSNSSAIASFTITAPSATVTAVGFTMTWTSAGSGVSYTVGLSTSSQCTSLDIASKTTTALTESIADPGDGNYFLCAKATLNGSNRSATNNGSSLQIATVQNMDLSVAPPADAGADNIISSFAWTMLRADTTTATSWRQNASLSLWQDYGCTSLPVTGVASSSMYPDLNQVPPSAGQFVFSDLKISKLGGYYFKLSSGNFSHCTTSQIYIYADGCTLASGSIRDNISANYSGIVTCRDSNPSATTFDRTTAKTLCKTGWHMCYPSEYDRMARAMWTNNTVINFTSNSSSMLNAEGAFNDGTTSSYFANNATGDACNVVSASQFAFGQGPGDYAGSTGKKWTAYKNADYSLCTSDSTADIENPTGYRPNGFRSVAFAASSYGPGAICCKNHHSYFNCADYLTSPTCAIYTDACLWNGSFSRCEPR